MFQQKGFNFMPKNRSNFQQSLHRLFRTLFLLSFAALLFACGSDGVRVVTDFSNTQDIEEGTIVYFDDREVGEVVDAKKRGDGLFVTLELDQEATEFVSSDAAVVVNRLKQGGPLEIYNPNNSSGGYVEAGDTLQGLDSMIQLGAWLVGDAIQLGSGSLTSYVTSFQNYLGSNEFQQDKASVQQQLNDITTEAQIALQELEDELALAMQELGALEGIAASTVEQFGDEMSPLMQELAKNGVQLSEQLELFTEGLKNSDLNDQETGQALLESMVQTLAELNESINDGIQEGIEEGKSE